MQPPKLCLFFRLIRFIPLFQLNSSHWPNHRYIISVSLAGIKANNRRRIVYNEPYHVLQQWTMAEGGRPRPPHISVHGAGVLALPTCIVSLDRQNVRILLVVNNYVKWQLSNRLIYLFYWTVKGVYQNEFAIFVRENTLNFYFVFEVNTLQTHIYILHVCGKLIL